MVRSDQVAIERPRNYWKRTFALVAEFENLFTCEGCIIIDDGDRIQAQLWRTHERGKHMTAGIARTIDQHILHAMTSAMQMSNKHVDKLLFNDQYSGNKDDCQSDHPPRPRMQEERK